MPLFKGLSSKSTPKKAIDYITRADKAAFVSVRNLFEDEDYAEQFADTMRQFGKGKKFDERKYYHFKLSCGKKDNVSPEQAHLYAQELAAVLFQEEECVIATHTDTKTVHSHIIVNAVNPITGKKLRISERQYTAMKDEANRIGEEMGFTSLDFRKKAKNKRTNEEQHIILKGGTSWKEDLREVIEEAKQTSTTQEEFIAHLKLYGVEITRSKTEYSFLHPEKKKAIRGLKLGENYSKEIIDNVIDKNRHGTSGNAAGTNTGDERAQTLRDGKRPAQRSVSDIEREMQRIDRQAERARRGVDIDGGTSTEGQSGKPGGNQTQPEHSGIGNSSDNSGGKTVQSGNQQPNRKSNADFFK